MRKITKIVNAVFITLLLANLFIGCSELTVERDYYQIKIYNIDSDKQEIIIDEYLEKAYLPALHRFGINKVGVFKLTEKDTSGFSKIFVWIPFASLDQYSGLSAKLSKDKEYIKAGENYINSNHDAPPFVRIESTLLFAFKDSPVFGSVEHDTPKKERVYELRSYEAATEKLLQLKVEMFNEGGEAKIFKDLGFQPLFFGEVISGSAMPNLMYMSTFSDKKSQTEHWKAFRDDPAWLKLKAVERYNNTVSHIDKYYLYPTEYSDI